MAIGLNQHSRRSVIPSTFNQVSHDLEFLARGRVCDDIERIRLLIFSLFLVALIAFAILHSPMNAMSRPALPADNPPTTETVALGRRLYYDPRLSADNTIACESCHSLQSGFTDIQPASIGVGGRKGTRHSPTVINSAYSSLQFWDGGATSLEEQAKGPIENPVEMATAHAVVVKRLPADPKDVALVKPAWGTEDILAFLDSWTAPLPDNLRPPAELTTKQTAQNG
jgi:cytochrome c peroxidase